MLQNKLISSELTTIRANQAPISQNDNSQTTMQTTPSQQPRPKNPTQPQDTIADPLKPHSRAITVGFEADTALDLLAGPGFEVDLARLPHRRRRDEGGGLRAIGHRGSGEGEGWEEGGREGDHRPGEDF